MYDSQLAFTRDSDHPSSLDTEAVYWKTWSDKFLKYHPEIHWVGVIRSGLKRDLLQRGAKHSPKGQVIVVVDPKAVKGCPRRMFYPEGFRSHIQTFSGPAPATVTDFSLGIAVLAATHNPAEGVPTLEKIAAYTGVSKALVAHIEKKACEKFRKNFLRLFPEEFPWLER